jgi:DNA-binding protein HU-beta
VNKSELIDHIADRAGLTKADAGAALDAATGAIADTLGRGGEVSIGGFGKFSVSHRAARSGRNPATGATIQIAASKAPKFSAAKALKDATNK